MRQKIRGQTSREISKINKEWRVQHYNNVFVPERGERSVDNHEKMFIQKVF